LNRAKLSLFPFIIEWRQIEALARPIDISFILDMK